MMDVSNNDASVGYRVGGVSALILGAAYLMIIALYAPMGAPPLRVEMRLLYLAANSAKWWWIIGLSILTDLLFVPFTLSMYFALKQRSGYLVSLAAAFIGLFVILDLAITQTNYTWLMTLGSNYVAASTAAQKASIAAMAEPACAILQSNLLFIYNTLTLAVGILLISFVMRHSAFHSRTAYVGIAAGCIGIASVTAAFFSALSSAIILASCLITLWVILAGWDLFRRCL